MFKDRIKKIRQRLLEEKLDAILISAVSNITYLTSYANFSTVEREAYLLITKDEQFIITDGRYSEAVGKQAPLFVLFERNHKNTLEDFLKSLKKKIQTLGIEEDDLTVAEHKLLLKHFKKIQNLDIKQHRAIKTAEEIKKIEQACKLGDLAFEYTLKKIKPGISEKQLAFELECFIAKQELQLIKKNGAEVSFPAIVAFGKNSSVPHHQTGDTKLTKKGMFTVKQEACFILLDFSVRFDNYCSDMTRTVFLGQPNSKQKNIYGTVLEAQQRAVDFVNVCLKTGKKIMAASVDKAARDYIISAGYLTIPHSLGHGIGLQVHEHPSLSPRSKDILQEGMVFSIEPGIYLPGIGGVRIEDLFVLEKNQLRQITYSPKQIISIGI